MPPSVSVVLNRAMLAKPEDRYSSVREFFLEFKRAVEHPTGRAHDKINVFISYQRDQSAAWANMLAGDLAREHGIFAFVDTQRKDSAGQFPMKLQKAIENCDVFICLLAKRTLQSKWVQTEIRLACENGKPMVPVFQEGFVKPNSSQPVGDPDVQTLLDYDAVYLFDRRNIHVDYTIKELAKRIQDSVSKVPRARETRQGS